MNRYNALLCGENMFIVIFSRPCMQKLTYYNCIVYRYKCSVKFILSPFRICVYESLINNFNGLDNLIKL